MDTQLPSPLRIQQTAPATPLPLAQARANLHAFTVNYQQRFSTENGAAAVGADLGVRLEKLTQALAMEGERRQK